MTDACQNGRIITGPYRATRLWNAAVRAFHGGMPVSRHRRGLRVYDDCFLGADAVTWLHKHLCGNPNFASSVSKEQTTSLLKKFLKCGLLEDAVSGSGSTGLFKDRGLYRFSRLSPLRALRTPGRRSCSELRCSSKLALQQQSASPSLPDQKVCDGNSFTRRNSGRERGSYRRCSNKVHSANVITGGSTWSTEADATWNSHVHNIDDNVNILSVDSTQQRMLNIDAPQRKMVPLPTELKNEEFKYPGTIGFTNKSEGKYSTERGDLEMMTDDKENNSALGRKNKKSKNDYKNKKLCKESKPSFRFPRRQALQAIENTTNNGSNKADHCNYSGNDPANNGPNYTKNYKAATFSAQTKDKYSSNVYVPLGEILNKKRKSSATIVKDEAQHNAINTITEINHQPGNRKDISTKENQFPSSDNHDPRYDVCNQTSKSRSRVKSFLVKSSGNSSKYYNLIPRFGGENGVTNKNTASTTIYASSKTISPKLLHSVSAAPRSTSVSTAALLSVDVGNASKINWEKYSTGSMLEQGKLLIPSAVSLDGACSSNSDAARNDHGVALASWNTENSHDLRLEQTYVEAWLEL
uniref:DEP domain-containing protein 1A-like n=1 Tax=Hirondellea gigas TaxID=1518452 RepID=A0A6A7FU87_9CRUS